MYPCQHPCVGYVSHMLPSRTAYRDPNAVLSNSLTPSFQPSLVLQVPQQGSPEAQQGSFWHFHNYPERDGTLFLTQLTVAGTPTKTVMKPSKRVYDAEAANPVVVSQPPLAGKGYTTGGAPQTVAAPAGASLGTVQPVPVSTSESSGS